MKANAGITIVGPINHREVRHRVSTPSPRKLGSASGGVGFAAGNESNLSQNLRGSGLGVLGSGPLDEQAHSPEPRADKDFGMNSRLFEGWLTPRESRSGSEGGLSIGMPLDVYKAESGRDQGGAAGREA